MDNSNGDPSVRSNIDAIRKHVETLGQEYEAGYLRVARQQRLDEVWITEQSCRLIPETALTSRPKESGVLAKTVISAP